MIGLQENVGEDRQQKSWNIPSKNGQKNDFSEAYAKLTRSLRLVYDSTASPTPRTFHLRRYKKGAWNIGHAQLQTCIFTSDLTDFTDLRITESPLDLGTTTAFYKLRMTRKTRKRGNTCGWIRENPFNPSNPMFYDKSCFRVFRVIRSFTEQ